MHVARRCSRVADHRRPKAFHAQEPPRLTPAATTAGVYLLRPIRRTVLPAEADACSHRAYVCASPQRDCTGSENFE
jgi:hypothetical protein